MRKPLLAAVDRKPLLAAIDQGTSSTRCVLFRADGKIVAQASLVHTHFFPQPGYVEHDPISILDCVEKTMHMAMTQAKVTAKNIAAVGIASQRESIVCWDKETGEPLHQVIVWQDTRTRNIVNEVQEHFHYIQHNTGLIPSTYISAPKITWLLRNIPEIKNNPHAVFGTVDSWLTFKLTGQFITDTTNASRTGVMSLDLFNYDPALLALFDIAPQQLPEIVPTIRAHGEITRGPMQGVLLGAIIGDQHAGLLGQGCINAGDTKNTYGTGNFLMQNTGNSIVSSAHNLISTVAYHIEGSRPVYALEGSVGITGALIEWLRDNLGIITTLEEVERLALSVPDNGGVYFVPAFSGLLAPYWRSDACGTIVGLTRHSTKAHIARAAVESVALQTYDVFTTMLADTTLEPPSVVQVDGGMTKNAQLMQFQADLLHTEIVVSQSTEITALGAAFAAGLSAGIYSSLSEIEKVQYKEASYHPHMEETMREKLITRWHRAIEKSLDWVE